MLSALGYTPDHKFSKLAEICSTNFIEIDYVYREDGSRLLKRDAVPIQMQAAFDLSSSRTFRRKIM
ncbi:unnamed protein product [Acanthoscelides obtectus]|uniref:Uncharacterized protein n=1 Tax=Acanthoscelides obtectus TaxID=200917 RepID=A0A9P0K4D5_ACAOB|nr:unnamed protein product [Acanthoscelides obtectus]CAK1627462.1 hypothetical protein AOBTE_LOCUS4615 [Acanthoscelides obtectus]